MMKERMHDPIFLAGKSEIVTKEDLQVAKDIMKEFNAKFGASSCFEINE